MTSSVGVDIGTGSIKVVSIFKEGESFVLESMGEVKTPKVNWRAPSDSKKEIEEVASGIRTLMRDLKIKSKQVVTCLPEDEVISRLIRLPPLKDSEIRDALKFEAETFVPYPLDQVSIDYEIEEKDDSGRLAVFAIAAKNDLISAYVRLFKAAGLELLALESPAVAINRVIKLSVPETVLVMVVDLGEKYSDVVGIDKGRVYFTRAMSVGGESITRAISINLGLDMASAEEYKKAYGIKEFELEGKIKNAILPVFSNMAEELRRAMVSFKEEQGRPVDLLVLSGGGANLPGFAEELTKILGVETQVILPFLKINTSKVSLPVNLSSEGCRFSLAVGLALRGLI